MRRSSSCELGIMRSEEALAENDRIAKALRETFLASDIYCLNLIGSSGAGKTSLLEATLAMFPLNARVAVISAHSQPRDSATGLARYGFPVWQIDSPDSRLNAALIEKAYRARNPAALDYLFIENPCSLGFAPEYDLGERDKVMIYGVTDGEDLPEKHPSAFRRAGLVILNKIDLLPSLSFDLAQAKENISKANPDVEILRVSSKTGAGLRDWYEWLEGRRAYAAGTDN